MSMAALIILTGVFARSDSVLKCRFKAVIRGLPAAVQA